MAISNVVLKKNKVVTYRINIDVLKFTKIDEEIKSLIDKFTIEYIEKNENDGIYFELTPTYKTILQGKIDNPRTKKAY